DIPPLHVQHWFDASWGAELALTHLARYCAQREVRDIELAVRYGLQAQEIMRTSMPAAAAVAMLSRAAVETPEGPTEEQVRQAHRNCIRNGAVRYWYVLQTTYEVAEWCQRRGRAARASNAARVAFDILQQAVTHEYQDKHKLIWLRWLAKASLLAVDCLAADSWPGPAAQRAERARALILSERFADESIELLELSAAGHTELAGRLRAALDQSRRTDTGPRQQEAAGNEVLRVSEQVRALPDFAEFRMPIEADRIAEIAGDSTLAYLVPAASGGWALLHQPARGWQSVRLPECRTDVPPVVAAFQRAVLEPALPPGARRRA